MFAGEPSASSGPSCSSSASSSDNEEVALCDGRTTTTTTTTTSGTIRNTYLSAITRKKLKRKERKAKDTIKFHSDYINPYSYNEIDFDTISEKKIVLIGLQGVGKSAIAVRHITNRFIGDYRSGEDSYVCEDRKRRLKYEIRVKSGHISQEATGILRNSTDGFLIIYDVTSRASFLYAKSVLETLRLAGGKRGAGGWHASDEEEDEEGTDKGLPCNDCCPRIYGGPGGNPSDLLPPGGTASSSSLRDRKRTLYGHGSSSCGVPVTLLGNKRDLDHRREVSVEEGQNLSLESECNFLEISTAESSIGPNLAIQMLLKEMFFHHFLRTLTYKNEQLVDDNYKDGEFFIPHPGTGIHFLKGKLARNGIERSKHHFKEFSNTASTRFSSRSSSCSSHNSSSNYSTCGTCSSNDTQKSGSLRKTFKTRECKNDKGSTEFKGIFSDMRSTLGNIFHNSLSRKTPQKHLQQ